MGEEVLFTLKKWYSSLNCNLSVSSWSSPQKHHIGGTRARAGIPWDFCKNQCQCWGSFPQVGRGHLGEEEGGDDWQWDEDGGGPAPGWDWQRNQVFVFQLLLNTTPNPNLTFPERLSKRADVVWVVCCRILHIGSNKSELNTDLKLNFKYSYTTYLTIDPICLLLWVSWSQKTEGKELEGIHCCC